MYKQEDYKILIWYPKGPGFLYATEEWLDEWEKFTSGFGEIEITAFLPLTPVSVSCLAMTYPDLPISSLTEAIDSFFAQCQPFSDKHYFFNTNKGVWE